jgi:hypothetical protein
LSEKRGFEGKENPGFGQLQNRASLLVIRVDLDQGLRPVAPPLILSINDFGDIGRRDPDETPRETFITLDDLIPKGERIHAGLGNWLGNRLSLG